MFAQCVAEAVAPVLRGVGEVFGDSDVYEAAPPADATILLRGQVLTGMRPEDPPADYVKKRADGGSQGVNDPMMPVVWTREIKTAEGKSQRIVCSTMGAATDLAAEVPSWHCEDATRDAMHRDGPVEVALGAADSRDLFSPEPALEAVGVGVLVDADH